ncbi:hypothetical protein BXZ70DRAFT_894580 [Cristinia sonorae]|uniref:Cyclin N-terminal domain-containing protein n=1 Tax=Cristinia sonorae TaxID=1940300 RepID=A0A8K0ULM5_9AGAR|nr:hypothetical protein BXZ70DRAFT_894580 [Cristinia sonorae]
MHPKYSPESPLHEASLVDYTLHPQALLELIEIKISKTFIDYIVDCTSETVDLALGCNTRASGSSRPSRKAHHQFVADLIHRAEVKIPVLLVALVYIDRARAHLEIAIDQYAFERVFLGGVILANKYLNDSTLKNVHWAMCSRIFRTRDIGRIEREFLDVLDFELGVSEADILSHHASIIEHSDFGRQRFRSIRLEYGRRRASTQSHLAPDSPFSSHQDDNHAFGRCAPTTPRCSSSPHTAAHVFTPPSQQQPQQQHNSHSHHHHHHHRLSIPSAFSIFKHLPIFHHHHHHHATSPSPDSDSPTESTSSEGSTSSSSGASSDVPSTTMSAVAIGF